MIKKNDSLPPAINDLDMFSVSQKKQISELGAPSTISRVDSESGMMLLPFGVERGVSQGTVFTVWKDKREAARIRVQSSRDGFLLAYILPRFGEPQNLRPGDSIYIIPEEEQNLYFLMKNSFIFKLLILSVVLLSVTSCFTASPDDDRMPQGRPASWEYSLPGGFDRGGGFNR